MDRQFWIEEVALHLVDRERESLARCAPIRWDDYSGDEKEAIADYLEAQLGRAWLPRDELSTYSGTFLAGSPVEQAYRDFNLSSTDFYGHSVKLAETLYEATPHEKATPGALLTVWFYSPTGRAVPYLGLLKLDVDDAYVLYLRDHGAAPALKKLAVDHVHDALPRPSRRVLKWAITPHPFLDGVDLHLRDEQSIRDVAKYFRQFLGCTLGVTVRDGFEKELRVEDEQADAAKGKGRDRSDLPEMVERVASRQPGRDRLAEKLLVVYDLSSGIAISGPPAKMARVKITGSKNRGYTFTAKANDFTTAYVFR